jgi:hypothetical protein
MPMNMPVASAVAVQQQVPRPRSVSLPPRWLRPGWPFAILFVGFPVWWVLGFGDFGFLILSIPMAADLLRRRQLIVPRAFGAWLLFLAWVVFAVLTLQVNAPGTVAAENGSRYLTWFYRLCWYVTVTVVMLYVLNNRKALSILRVARIMGWMFVWITLGGLAGVLAPSVQFHSLLELMLPSHIASNGFINALIHPSFAQIQFVLGYESPRPSAPFAYANTWGVNYACFLPFFIYGWFSRGSGWRRRAAPVVLALGTVPVIYSLNRGLWVALAVAGLFIAIRAALMGKPGLFASVLTGGLVVVLVLAFSPLGALVAGRLAHPHSNTGRENLSLLAVTSVWSKSPVVGLGTTRTVQGTFNSISGSRTAACPHCSPPALGTQGQMWLVILGQGLGGLFFYLLFFVLQFLYQIRRRGPTVTMGLSVLIMGFVTMPVYDSIGTALLAIMVAISLMTRDTSEDRLAQVPLERSRQSRASVRPLATVGGYLSLLRQSARIIVVCVVTGGILAASWQALQGTRSIATVGVVVTPEPANPIPATPPLTLDSDAQLLYSTPVLNAASHVAGQQVTSADPDLAITATPGTHILHIAYTANNPAVASETASAAASAFIAVLAQHDAQRSALQLSELRARAASLDATINAQAAVLYRLQAPSVQRLNDVEVKSLKKHTSSTILAAQRVKIQIDRVTSRQPTPPQIVQPVSTSPQSDVWRVSIATGLALGLLLGVMLGWLRHLRSPRLRRTSDVTRLTDIPVLAVVPLHQKRQNTSADLDPALLSLDVYRPTAFVSASARSESGVELAERLDQRLWRSNLSSESGSMESNRSPRVVLVVAQGTRAQELTLVHDRLSQAGSTVAGVVFTVRTSNRKSIK